MKLIYKGTELDLTVDELKEMVDKGLLKEEENFWESHDGWQKIIDDIKKSNIPRDPFRGNMVMLYGCEIPTTTCNVDATKIEKMEYKNEDDNSRT